MEEVASKLLKRWGQSVLWRAIPPPLWTPPPAPGGAAREAGDNAKKPIAVKQSTSGGIFIDSTSLSIALERGSTAQVRPFAKPFDPPPQRPWQALLPHR